MAARNTAAAKPTAAKTTAAKPSTARRTTTRTTAQKPEAPTVDMAALIAETVAAQVTAALAGMTAAKPEADEPDTTGVSSAQGYHAPNGQPDLSATADEPSSAKQKRYLADLLMSQLEADGKRPSPAQIKAWKAYQEALNLLLVSLGISGAASLEKGDAQ